VLDGVRFQTAGDDAGRSSDKEIRVPRRELFWSWQGGQADAPKDPMMANSSGRRRSAAVGSAVLGALLTWCSLTSASTLDISQYAHATWKVADGFADGAIYNVAQTPDGYLWIGTDFGVLRFDGVRTTPWSANGLLPSRNIRTVVTGRDGTLWIGTVNGLASWKDGKLSVYPEFAHHAIKRAMEARDGTVWAVGSTFGLTILTGELCAVRNGAVRCWGKDGAFGSRVVTMYEDRKGNLSDSTEISIDAVSNVDSLPSRLDVNVARP